MVHLANTITLLIQTLAQRQKTMVVEVGDYTLWDSIYAYCALLHRALIVTFNTGVVPLIVAQSYCVERLCF